MTQAGIDEFVAVVGRFCKYAEGAAQLSLQRRIFEGRKVLAALYTAALELPLTATAATLPAELEPAHLQLSFGAHDAAGAIAADFAEVHTELSRGLALMGFENELVAVAAWRFGFDARWGEHVVNALRALHVATASCVQLRSLDPLLLELKGKPWSRDDLRATVDAIMHGQSELELSDDTGDNWFWIDRRQHSLLYICATIPLVIATTGLGMELARAAQPRCAVLEVQGFDDLAFTASKDVLTSVFGGGGYEPQPFTTRDFWYHTVSG